MAQHAPHGCRVKKVHVVFGSHAQAGARVSNEQGEIEGRHAPGHGDRLQAQAAEVHLRAIRAQCHAGEALFV